MTNKTDGPKMKITKKITKIKIDDLIFLIVFVVFILVFGADAFLRGTIEWLAAGVEMMFKLLIFVVFPLLLIREFIDPR